ncbi:MAG: RluA family pseudouridine synthase [Gammaproteobacteria bacterium]
MQSTHKLAVQYISISEHNAEQRIDNFLFNFLKNVPKTHIYRLLRTGQIRVNKKRVKAPYKLQIDDVIRIPPLEISDDKPAYQPATSTRIMLLNTIIYEDENLLIINKPAGMPVHAGSTLQGGVIEAFRVIKPELKFLELAHRIDRDTSGCLIIAKKRSILKELHELFREGQIKKMYEACVLGKWPSDKKIVNLSLHKNHLASGDRKVVVSDSGKSSLTYFKPIQYFEVATLVEARIATGRTHQIRVHAASVGHPIAGDDKYGDFAFNRYMKERGCKRLFLHAKQVTFYLKSIDKKISVSSALPDDLAFVLAKLK